jgi:hypothetical protein
LAEELTESAGSLVKDQCFKVPMAVMAFLDLMEAMAVQLTMRLLEVELVAE